MACTNITLAGIANDCSGSMGGIKQIWIAPYSAGTMVYELDESGNTTGKVTLSGLTSASTDYQHYYFRKGNANATSTLNVDIQNGVNYVSTELQMTFTKQETSKRLEISALVLSDVQVVYEDANGKWFALGIDNPVNTTAGTAQTGAAKTDGNNYQITLTADEITFPSELDENSLEIFKQIVANN